MPVDDDEDCGACSSGQAEKSKDAFNALFAKMMPVPGAAAGGAASKATAAALPCPENRESLGRAGWSLLHTVAAYYPQKPTLVQQAGMSVFVRLFGQFYPCHECRDDFLVQLRASPVRVGSRYELAVWMCERHNGVNLRLGKPCFPCDAAALRERWRAGAAGCRELD